MRLSSDYTTKRIFFLGRLIPAEKISAVHRCSKPAAARTRTLPTRQKWLHKSPETKKKKETKMSDGEYVQVR